MTLPTHLEVEMAAYMRGDLDNDTERRVQFMADVLSHGDIPHALENDAAGLVADGVLSPRGDILRDADDLDDEHDYNVL